MLSRHQTSILLASLACLSCADDRASATSGSTTSCEPTVVVQFFAQARTLSESERAEWSRLKAVTLEPCRLLNGGWRFSMADSGAEPAGVGVWVDDPILSLTSGVPWPYLQDSSAKELEDVTIVYDGRLVLGGVEINPHAPYSGVDVEAQVYSNSEGDERLDLTAVLSATSPRLPEATFKLGLSCIRARAPTIDCEYF